MNPIKSAVVCCLAFFLPAAAIAKEPSVRLLADHVPADLGQLCLVAGKKKSDPMSLPINSLSAAVVVPDRHFELRRIDGNEALASVELPAKGREFVVMLSSIDTGFQAAVIPADDRSFKKGDVYLFNNSGETIVGKVGGAELEIENGKGIMLHPEAKDSETSYSVSFKVREDSGERVLSNTSWPVEENMRSYVFFYVDPKRERISFRSVDEFIGD
ncbi:hypothetical protein [Haloferula sp.]|uniref:hypothetical protein n=1 Tax=Haloferula sp. TaxID=2497595 RepID=UPI003C70F517